MLVAAICMVTDFLAMPDHDPLLGHVLFVGTRPLLYGAVVWFLLKQRRHLLLIPQMVARGDDVHPAPVNLPRHTRRDPRPPRGILAVRDHHMHRMLRAHCRQQFLHRPPPRLAHDVPDKQYSHRVEPRGMPRK